MAVSYPSGLENSHNKKKRFIKSKVTCSDKEFSIPCCQDKMLISNSFFNV